MGRESLIENLEGRVLLASTAKLVVRMNFQPDAITPPPACRVDTGAAYGVRKNKLTYGWTSDVRARAFDRNRVSDQRYDTGIDMQKGGNCSWEFAVPSGKYVVRVVAGDPAQSSGKIAINVEGQSTVVGNPSSDYRSFEGSTEVTVTDGRLTISNAWGANANKINFVEIHQGGTIVWKTAKSSPVARIESQRAVVGGKLYLFGGYLGDWWPQPRSDVYDPATNTWKRIKDMPIGLTHGATVVDGTSVIIVGGYTQAPNGQQKFGTKQVLKYDTKTNAYSRLPDLPQSRAAGGAAIVGRWLHYFAGERSDRTAVPEHWAINLDNLKQGWKNRTGHPLPVTHQAVEVVNGKIYCIAGQSIGESLRAEHFLANNWVYDPVIDKWKAIADNPGPRSHLMPASFVRDGKIVVLGGENAYNYDLRTVHEYDPATNNWSELTPLPKDRASGVAAYISGKIIFTTGKSRGAWFSDTWIGTFTGAA